MKEFHNASIFTRLVMGDREFSEPGDSESVHLSQDSQLSVVSMNSSVDLSQGSVEADKTVGSKHRRSDKKKKKRSKSEKSSKTRDKEKCGRERSETPDCDNSDSKSSKRSSKSSSKSENSEKKSKRHSSRRPEPEGGNPSQPDGCSTIEYERIINSTDPLFSDLEIDINGEDADIQKPRRQMRHNRSGPSGIFIPCTQLGINSNTMIKFAIIGTELQNIFQVSLRVGIRLR